MVRMSSLCLLTLALAAPIKSSRVQTSPSAPQPEFVNDHVRVRRVLHAPHRPVALHDVPPALIVYVTAAHERATYGDGSTKEVRFKPGEYEWWPGGRLGAENLEDVPNEILVIVTTGK